MLPTETHIASTNSRKLMLEANLWNMSNVQKGQTWFPVLKYEARLLCGVLYKWCLWIVWEGVAKNSSSPMYPTTVILLHCFCMLYTIASCLQASSIFLSIHILLLLYTLILQEICISHIMGGVGLEGQDQSHKKSVATPSICISTALLNAILNSPVIQLWLFMERPHLQVVKLIYSST